MNTCPKCGARGQMYQDGADAACLTCGFRDWGDSGEETLRAEREFFGDRQRRRQPQMAGTNGRTRR